MKASLHLAALAVGVAGWASAASAGVLTVDSTKSRVGFSIGHMLVMSLDGSFSGFSGSIDRDDRNLDASKVSFTVDVGSISTDNKERDEHLRTADFFDVASFPKATFISTKIERVGDNSYRMLGELTIRGKSKSVAFDLNEESKSGNTSTYVAKGAINRLDFGIGESSMMIGDDVTLTVTLTTNQSAQSAQR